MAKLGIHAFCFTPGWEAKNADAELPPLKELGIGVVGYPCYDLQNLMPREPARLLKNMEWA